MTLGAHSHQILVVRNFCTLVVLAFFLLHRSENAKITPSQSCRLELAVSILCFNDVHVRCFGYRSCVL
jgi:hypothetical protein